MTKSRGILPPRYRWTEGEIELLTRLYPDVSTAEIATRFGVCIDRVYHKANQLGLKKSAAYLDSPAACRLRKGDNVGKETRFQKGHITWNDGKKGLSLGGIATQFKPGRLPHEAHNYLPIGSTRLSVDGYLERKISDDRTIAPARRWVGVHRLVWESINGPIQKGNVVVFRKDLRTTNEQEITIDRLELISRQDLMRRNTVHQYGPEIAQIVRLRGAITRQINRREKSNEQ